VPPQPMQVVGRVDTTGLDSAPAAPAMAPTAIEPKLRRAEEAASDEVRGSAAKRRHR
jgi:hypothetical protein